MVGNRWVRLTSSLRAGTMMESAGSASEPDTAGNRRNRWYTTSLKIANGMISSVKAAAFSQE